MFRLVDNRVLTLVECGIGLLNILLDVPILSDGFVMDSVLFLRPLVRLKSILIWSFLAVDWQLNF